MPKIGVIAGSGFYEIPGARRLREEDPKTPFGAPSASYSIVEIQGFEAAFLPRHGSPHRIPPHQVNYRANLWGFRELGVERVIAINAAGGIDRSLKPGDMVVLDQIIDMTHSARESTFYDGEEVVHVDFTDPYCPELRFALLASASKAGIAARDRGTYVCVNGPRLESRAEIAYFGTIGAGLVGMTGMPEAALARELELCFACISVVTNYAAGIREARLTTSEVVETMTESTQRLKVLIKEALSHIPSSRQCACKTALKDAKMD